MNFIVIGILLGLAIAIGYGLAMLAFKNQQRLNKTRLQDVETQAQQILSQAEIEAQQLRETLKVARDDWERSSREKQQELDQRQQLFETERSRLERRLSDLSEREAQLIQMTQKLEAQRAQDSEQAAQAREELNQLRAQSSEQAAQAKEELLQLRAQANSEAALARESLAADRKEVRAEREALKSELERLNRRAEQLDARGDKLDAFEESLEKERAQVARSHEEVVTLQQQAEAKLYEVASLSPEAAREQILNRIDAELTEQKAVRVRVMIEQASAEAKQRAREIITQAIQRSAAETTTQLTVSVVPLPHDSLKGRLIGREGRNIRAFEALTGVDLIVDDTPEAVMLSSFNPIRREVARHVLESLVADGRIHPTRIEEMVQKSQDEMKVFIHQQGESAALEAGVIGLKAGLLQLLGRMYFRTSYGQNVLKHSIQVAHLAGIMADELGLDPVLARRAGLLHDIGKSIDREIDGTHVEIGVQLGKRFAEPFEVIDSIAHHHDPENGETLYSVLVAAADAISAARPGARREDLESYVRRLEMLEEIATSFPGIQQAYAIQAGREVRVIVQPEKVSDAQATLLARDIAARIEQDMEYPGQVQVTVIRESRASGIAR